MFDKCLLNVQTNEKEQMEISELIALVGRVSCFDGLFRISENAHGDGRAEWRKIM